MEVIKNSVFGSKSEKSVYENVFINWGENFSVFPNLRVGEIIYLKNCHLNTSTFDTMTKSHFNFALCQKETGKPLVSIEFDGIGKGYSKNDEYRRLEERNSILLNNGDKVNLEMRDRSLRKKLQLCNKINYPLFIVSYSETESSLLYFIFGERIFGGLSFLN